MSNAPETTTLTLKVWVYNGTYDPDYDELRECLTTSATDKGYEAIFVVLEHFAIVISDQLASQDAVKVKALAPTILGTPSFDMEECFLNIENLAWRLTKSTKLGEDVEHEGYVTGVEHEGYVMFDVEMPRGMDRRTFVTEFNSLFTYYSNKYVEWGWMDMGYILDAPSINLA